MIDIIAHRGYWLESKEKNSSIAFNRALEGGYGIETDVRDFNGDLVISHDIANDSCMPFDEFISIVEKYDVQTLAVNVKSDGLQGLLDEQLSKHKKHFYFDMSIPDTLGYMQKGMIYYVRISDIEPIPSEFLYQEAVGVWLDKFNSATLDLVTLHSSIEDGKYVVLVSPELHGFPHQEYWQALFDCLKEHKDKCHLIGLCTDYPAIASDFFNK